MCGGWGVPEEDELSPDEGGCGKKKVLGPDFDKSRRAFTSASIATPVVASLLSRPVWGGPCSISGLASGNLSGRTEQQGECTSGCTPGFWKNNTEAWSRTPWSPGNCSVTNNGGHCTQWNATVGIGADSFESVFGFTAPDFNFGVSLMEILLLSVKGNHVDPNHAHQAHWVAAVLNAAADPISYGTTWEKVVEAVRCVHFGLGDCLLYADISPDQLHTFLSDNNERGCQFNAKGDCAEGFTSTEDGRCIPACGSDQTYDINTKTCIDNNSWDKNTHSNFTL